MAIVSRVVGCCLWALVLLALVSLPIPAPVAASGALFASRAPEVAVRHGAITPRPRRPGFVWLADGREAVAGRLLVAFHEGVGAVERAAIHRWAAGPAQVSHRGTIARGTVEVVELAGAASLTAVAAAYRRDPRVAGAEPDYLIRAASSPDGPLPDDPLLPNQWNLLTVQAPLAWQTTHGAPARTIAVLDCGIAAHPDLAGKVVLTANFVDGPPAVCDHATQVAGIAAAATNNGVGIAGVGYETRLLDGRILQEVQDASGHVEIVGTVSDLIEGITWAADQGADVINLSLYGPGACPGLLQRAIDYATGRQAVVVAAAGNTGNTAPQFPADCRSTLAVGGTQRDDVRVASSSFGAAWVDLAAPSEAIVSLDSRGGYAILSGTSAAAPHVAGVAALVWASCDFSRAQQVMDRVMATADRIAGTGVAWRYGRVNAARAICPTAPADLRPGYISATSIHVRWTDRAIDEQYFEVERTTPAGEAVVLTVGRNVSAITMSGLPSGQLYAVRVRACNRRLCSLWAGPLLVATLTR